MNFENICQQAIGIVKQTGTFIKNERLSFNQSSVEVKGLHNFVSYVDTTAEHQLVDGLSGLLPEAGYIAEEGTGAPSKNGLNWVIDPLDGTTNFIHGLSPYAISVALMQDEKVVVGIVYEVSLDECFYSWINGGAYLNGRRIHVSNSGKVSDALIATGFPYYAYDRIKPFFQTMEYFMENSHGLRRLGSAATDLAYVACGRFEAFYEYSLNPWDVAAGSLLVEEAGGRVADFSGKKNYIFGKEIVATNMNIYTEFQGIVSRFMVENK